MLVLNSNPANGSSSTIRSRWKCSEIIGNRVRQGVTAPAGAPILRGEETARRPEGGGEEGDGPRNRGHHPSSRQSTAPHDNASP